MIKDIPFYPDPTYRPPPKLVGTPMPESTDINPEISINFEENSLFQEGVILEKETALLAIPEICADKIITLYHSSLFTGHKGVIKTHLTINNKFFIPNLIHYLQSYIKGCLICQLACNENHPMR